VKSKRKIIKCSQCDLEFSSGHDYRIHWEKHLNDFLDKKKMKKDGSEQD
tara:strand:- start:2688 stop:2834 length:147 start_codon:yes stop_codon:yes gene_type:complete